MAHHASTDFAGPELQDFTRSHLAFF